MNKKFIKWQLKEWLPILCVTFIVCFVSMVLPPMRTKFFIKSYISDSNAIVYKGVIPSLSDYSIAPLFFAFLFPLFVLDYRFSRRKSDTFYQLPLKEEELKRTRVLLGLISIFVIFTVSYWSGVLITYLFQSAEFSIILANNPNCGISMYKYIYFLPFYFCMLIGISAEYFFSLLFSNFGNTKTTAVLNSIFGNLIFAFFVVCIDRLFISFSIYKFDYPEFIKYSLYYFPFLSLHPALTITANSIQSFANLINGGEFSLFIKNTFTIPFLVICLLFSFFTILIDFMKKDPSGEYSGSFQARQNWMNYIPHLAGFILYFSSSGILTNNLMILLISSIIFLSFEYLIICMMRKTFKLKIIDYVIFGALFVASIFQAITLQ